ncbi:MAG: Elongation factor Ts [Parcubacteria group bacterium GW2011_GWF2_44_8]|nr:MAG: Elongation factor Ts [Parcubacteria group bacterium GW2011_GWF2_44_8]
MITAKQIAELRAKTGSGMMDCKQALEEASGNEEKAVEILRKKGAAKAAKKADREAKEGIIESYIHANGKIGVLVEVLSETDFVAKNEEFKQFAHDIALHIAAMSPLYVSREEVPAEAVAREKEILMEEVKSTGKPAEIAEKIVEGRLGKFYGDICLLDQPFAKDQTKIIQELLNEKIAKIGEKIEIRRFCRFEIGV